MKKGFNIIKSGHSDSKYVNNAGEFSLVASREEIEAFVSIINKGKSILCFPSESIDSFHVLFVSSGKLFHTNTQTYLYPGDVVSFTDLAEVHHLSVLEQTTIFRVSNKIMFDEKVKPVDDLTDIMDIIQQKDDYTENHCNRTGNLACQIGVVLKASEDTVNSLIFGSKIHDVGKININNQILNKKGKLTDLEYDAIKKHTIDGYNIVMESLNNKSYALLVQDHHERLDGSGYPNGLKGNEISLEARILAVADAFDAMTSERPYRKALSSKIALQELYDQSISKYDIKVVQALEKVLSFNLPDVPSL